MNDRANDHADLVELARAYGVATEYEDQGQNQIFVDAAIVRAVLAALGVEASSDSKCRKALAALQQDHWDATIADCIVLRRSTAPDAEPWQTWVHVPAGEQVRLWVELEDGARRFDLNRTEDKIKRGMSRGARVEEVIHRIPLDLPLGWHSLVAEVSGQQHSCNLVVTPERLNMPDELHDRRGWGISLQLYSARSKRSWGIGDLADLADLASWFGNDHGADLILVNPLHAGAPTEPMEASPYLPVTRRFVNPLYIRVEDIPEFGYLSADVRDQIASLATPLHDSNLSADLLDRNASWHAKKLALEYVNAVELTPGRQAQLDQYRAAEGVGLRLFATWCVLAERFGPSWQAWPQDLQHPESERVAEEAEPARIAFYEWVQWVLDEQMANAQLVAKESGMNIGIMHDLAVGVHRFGSDTWSERDVMAMGIQVGAPPDRFNQVGQNWSQPPRRPDRLASTGYESYRDMLRSLLRHSGGLRIDHVLGLFRLWCIPVGSSAKDGTYLRYDHNAMVNILVLEAQRAGAVIVGEDLGTVEPWVRDFLADRGILGTIILYFEREKRNGVSQPRPPERWRPNAMATVTVHDLPPSAGYIAGDHVGLRHELGLLNQPFEQEMAAHQLEIDAWREILIARGLLRKDADADELIVALHRAMTLSPVKLLAVALPDLVGERRTQNQPGTSLEYPNWRVPLCDAEGKPVLIEHLPSLDRLSRIIAALGASPRRRPST